MPFKIALREVQSKSFFKRYLHVMAEARFAAGRPVGELWIASGYFNGDYVSKEPHHKTTRTLPQAIALGCTKVRIFATREHVKPTKPGHMPHAVALRDFVASIPTGVGVSVFGSAGATWHAKIALRVIDDQPIAAIIGSSNITRPPYCERPYLRASTWNYECDVLIWTDQVEYNATFAAPVSEELGEGTEVLGQAVGSGDQLSGASSIPDGRLEDQLRALKLRLEQQTTPQELGPIEQ